MDLTTEAGVLELMESSRSDREWDDNADRVKAANGRDYPRFWYRLIVQSGVMKRVAGRWGGDDKIHLTVHH